MSRFSRYIRGKVRVETLDPLNPRILRLLLISFLDLILPKQRLLIIEDEASVAKQLKWSLDEDYDITIASNAEKSKELLACGAFPVATLDLGLPPSPDTPQVGLKLLEELATIAPRTKVIVITGNSEMETGVKAIESGAVDFCAKPIELKVLRVVLDRTFRMHALEEANRQLRKQTDQCDSLCGMIGVAPVMQTLFSKIRKTSSNDYPVLITGESGTGKEMVAHAIHELGPRRDQPPGYRQLRGDSGKFTRK